MRFLLIIGLLIPTISVAQVGATEYFSSNGEYRLVCVQSIDTASAYNVLYKKGETKPIWESFGLEMSGHIGVSNSGKIVWFGEICSQYHVNGFCLKRPQPDSMVLHITGLQVKLGRVLSERLYELPVDPSNKPVGILLNDTIIHKMAENPFFIDDDKVFVCTKPATLNVFDINTGEVLYVGPGRNHFTQNYYSIPNPPYSESYPVFFKDSGSNAIPLWMGREKWLQPNGTIGRPLPAKGE